MARTKFTLSRRSVLRGLGGVSIALPFLEIMADNRAFAQSAPPKRYIVCFGGQSLGADGDPVHSEYVPDIVGPDYDLKTALKPLAGFDSVKNEITVVSGLRIPTEYDNGGTIPPGGRPNDFHVSTASPLLSGVRASSSSATCNGETSDQIVANAIAGDTPFKSLVYRVQAAWYLSVSAPYGRDIISYKKSGSNIVPVPATVSPKQAFESLFGNFVPPDNTEEIEKANFVARSRRSILDLVAGNTQQVMKKVGTADRLRLQQHLDEIRALETRIQTLPPPAQGICQVPPDPGADPAVGGNQPDGEYTTNNGYSDEDTRARIFCDLIHMALCCDLTRVAALQFTMFQSHMNMYPLIGLRNDLHEIGHSSDGTHGMALAQAWHTKHFGYLVAKLRDTKEAGVSMLENTVLTLLHEGGHGFDPSSGNQNSSHSSERMACLIAGRVGGLKPGRHVVAQDQHPAQVLVTAMKAVGVNTNSLGEVTGDIPALRG
ncbi:MAG: DUF1552 domain-containing protein [Myxococcaceae bacterium]|nr:DUF1552 domain-containing protein [Myxococcaceae bacterium]